MTPEIQNLLPGAAREGAQLAGVRESDEPLRIVEAINAFIANPPKAGFLKRVDNWNERAMPLGALWGAQLVRQFGWQWAIVEDDGDDSIGVVDPQRTMAVYPFDTIYGWLEEGAYPTLLLAFNMLAGGSLPAFPIRGYEPIMDGISHIVPPR